MNMFKELYLWILLIMLYILGYLGQSLIIGTILYFTVRFIIHTTLDFSKFFVVGLLISALLNLTLMALLDNDEEE